MQEANRSNDEIIEAFALEVRKCMDAFLAEFDNRREQFRVSRISDKSPQETSAEPDKIQATLMGINEKLRDHEERLLKLERN